MEEAAASGRIEQEPFTRYRYPAWKPPDLPGEVCVEAYLMEVESVGSRRSAERPTAWVGPEEAVRKLAENRDRAYAREHRRVIDEALARVQGFSPPAE